MLRRLVQWFKRFFQRLFGGQQTDSKTKDNVPKEPAPPLTDTDLEFLFTELLEGVHQARGQAWAQKWLHNIEHRVSSDRWIEWLQRFGERLIASPTPNNELAARLVQLGELGIGEVGNTAYDIGMQVLRRNQSEPIWEYEGPDAVSETYLPEENYLPQENYLLQNELNQQENIPAVEESFPAEGEYQTVSLEQLFVMLQQDENLRQQVAQQLAIETDDPQVIVQELINQYAANESTTDQG
ncbi:hypothetical protein [Halotia branconii]|uniref:Uncharacterized protein n=1 Tax=Halotia branconii CENA392 TaxID=1539056 RepID=A0AAJ6NYA2_9CYAN|nr:hypothetical protein [Halotia branconii]WGV28701.1 hypothetical protein QI031_03690 [Halotia branconii CENA392]